MVPEGALLEKCRHDRASGCDGAWRFAYAPYVFGVRRDPLLGEIILEPA
jgi:hypothetical protein